MEYVTLLVVLPIANLCLIFKTKQYENYLWHCYLWRAEIDDWSANYPYHPDFRDADI